MTRLKLERRVDARQGVQESTDLLHVMHQALSRRLDRIGEGAKKSVGILFSGGIDSVVLAALLHLSLEERGIDEAIELINVAFVDTRNPSKILAPDRLAAIASYVDLKNLFPSRKWVLIEVDITSQDRREAESHILKLILPQNTHMDLNIGTVFWFASRAQGHIQKVDYTEEDRDNVFLATVDGRPILRRGGDDAARAVGQVEWSNMKYKKGNNAQQCSMADCRRVAKGCCANLYCSKCCFEEQKRTGESCEVHKNNDNRISKDYTYLSRIDVGDEESTIKLQAASRILLVGIGADEQLGGYGRHRTAFTNGGGRTKIRIE